MEKSEIIIQLSEIFKEVFGTDSLVLTEELTANDVDNWDSLSHMLLISQIEETFSIKFKLKDLNKMKNVGEMIKIIISKLDIN